MLDKIINGKRIKPLALMVYGVHGIGKTSFPSESPSPIYIGSEETDEFDIARFPKVSSWQDLKDQLNALLKENHDYKTLVIDTVDGLEQVAQKDILVGKEKDKTMATAFGGYGKAYQKMSDMFLEIRDNYLIPLRDEKGMNIVLLVHADKTKHEDPMTMTSYDSYSTALHKSIKHIFEDWVSAILFANYKLYRAETDEGKKHAVGDGHRVFFTEERPSHMAKNRFGLPEEIEFAKTGAWKEVMSYIAGHYKDAKKKEVEESKPVESETMMAIKELIPRIPEDSMEKIMVQVERATGDEEALQRVYSRIQKLVA